MRKVPLAVALVFGLVVGLTASSAQDNLAGIDPTGQTVVYWHQYQNDSAQGDAIAALVEQFNATNEYGITVEASAQGTYSDIAALVNAGIVSGELPNLTAGYANDAASYDKDGVVADLAPYIASAEWGLGETPDINQSLIAANTIDEKVVAFPNQSSAQVMVYNQDLLTELGFEGPATTREEFKEQVCASANSTGPNGEDRLGFAITADSSAFESWVAGSGGVIYADGAFDFTSEAVTSTLQFYQDLYAEGCAYLPAERFGEQVDFNQGLTPYYVTSSAGFTFVLAGFADAGYDPEWAITTFPHTEDNEIVQAFVPSIIVLESTPEQELASWLFLKYFASPDVAVQWSAATGYFNPVPSSVETLVTTEFTAEGLAPYFNAAYALINNPDIRVTSSPAISAYGSVRGLISTAIADVTSNGLDVAAVTATLQAAAEQALADSQ